MSTIGIDIGKTTFRLIGLDERGAIVLQQKVSRTQISTAASVRVVWTPPE